MSTDLPSREPPAEPPAWAPDAIPRQASSAPRSRAPLCVLLVLLGLFAAGIGIGQAAHLRLPDFTALLPGSGISSSAAPTRLTIPAVDMRAKVVGVGQAPDGSIDVPQQDPVGTAGWYKLGVGPGDPGTAVIVGHVDTKSRSAVFARLPELKPGDRIEVTRRNGRVVDFAVDTLERTPKTAFPAGTIFATAAKPRLALVTCGGAWVGGPVGYSDNVIVYATATN